MKNLLHSNVSYKKIGLIFLGFALVIFIGSSALKNTPSTPSETSTQQTFYTNKKKTFTVQFPSMATVTESPDGSVSGELESPHRAKIMVSTFGNSDAIQKDMQIPASYTIQKIISLEDRTAKLLEVYKSQFQVQAVIVKSELSTVDRAPAYLVELSNDEVKINTLSYSFLKDGHYFEVAVIYSSDDEDYIVAMFNSFIASFKVL